MDQIFIPLILNHLQTHYKLSILLSPKYFEVIKVVRILSEISNQFQRYDSKYKYYLIKTEIEIYFHPSQPVVCVYTIIIIKTANSIYLNYSSAPTFTYICLLSK